MGDRAQTTRPDSERKEKGAKKKRDAAAADLDSLAARRKRGGAGMSVLDVEQVGAGLGWAGLGWAGEGRHSGPCYAL